MKQVIITSGLYEDYEIVGLYKTEHSISLDFLKEKQVEYAKFLGIFDEDLFSAIRNKSSVDRFFLEKIYKEMIAGYPMPQYSDTRNYKLYKSALGYFDDILSEKHAKNVDLIDWLCSTRVLHKCEFNEVCIDD